MNKFKFLAYTLGSVIVFESCVSAYNVYHIHVTTGDAPKHAKAPKFFITGIKKGAKDFTLPFDYRKNSFDSFIFDADSIRMLKSDSACKPKDYKNLPKDIKISLTYSGKRQTGHWECTIKQAHKSKKGKKRVTH